MQLLHSPSSGMAFWAHSGCRREPVVAWRSGGIGRRDEPTRCDGRAGTDGRARALTVDTAAEGPPWLGAGRA